jgi:hypothetical protein
MPSSDCQVHLPMSADFTEQLQGAIDHAIADGLRGNSEMATKWLALVEVMDGEGERALYMATSEGMKSWESLGLLMFGVQHEQSQAGEVG